MRRLWGIILSTLLFVSVLFLLPTNVDASVKKKDTSREIGIVFDNSGSMYIKNNKAWSEATYAIEVFASMLNDGDVLRVFPMNPVTVDGKEYSENNPLTIEKPSDALKIEKMITPDSAKGDTPIGTIQLAYDKVKKSDKDEKWLIVLTDGAEFYDVGNKYVDCKKDDLEILSAPGTDNDGKISALNLKDDEKGQKATTVGAQRALSTMLSKCADDVNTMYLGIGSAAVKPKITGKYAHDPVQAESSEVPSVLGEMCNMIFGRNILEMNGDNINFDIPLSKLIVFIQGEDIANVSLTGKSKLSPKESMKVHYSESGTEDGKWTPNTALQGIITTYTDGLVKDQTHKLGYSGNKSDIKVYYEPDVDLKIDIVDVLGNSVLGQPAIYAGDYNITYNMVDSEGNDVSDSKLLGKTEYDIIFTQNGKALDQPVKDKAGAIPVTLKVGDVLGFEKAEVTFLNNYTISKSPEMLGFPSGGFTIQEMPNTLAFKIVGGKDTYQMAELENDGKYRIEAYYNLEPIDLSKVENLKVTVGDGGEGEPVAKVDKDGTVTLEYFDNAGATNLGEHALKVAGSYTDEYGNVTVGQTDKKFSIADDAKTLGASMETVGDYYLLDKLGQDTPILITVTSNGQPLNQEEITALLSNPGSIKLNLDDNIKIDDNWVQVGDSSTFSSQIIPDGTKAGTHKITGTVSLSTKNQRYTPAEVLGYATVESLPRWVKLLIFLAILLLLAILILIIMNMKILPSKMLTKIAETEAFSGRDTMGAKPIKYSRTATVFGRMFSDASIIVMSGVDGDGQSISPIRLKIEKESKIKDVLFNRRSCKVWATLMEPSPTIKEINIGGVPFAFNKAANRFTDDSDRPASEHKVRLAEGSMIDIVETAAGYKKNKKLSYSVRIHMKW